MGSKGYANTVFAGADSSGGGDGQVYLFETAREEASERVNSLVLKMINTEDTRIQEFLLANSMQLANDILSSKHTWIKDDQTTCAQTNFTSSSPILLNYSACRGISLEDAIQLLIHESIHHLGIQDEEFSYSASQAVSKSVSSHDYLSLCNQISGKWLTRRMNDSSPFPSTLEVVNNGCDSFIFRNLFGIQTDFLFKFRRNYIQSLSLDDVINSFLTIHQEAKALAVTYTLIDYDNGMDNQDDRHQGIIMFELMNEDELRVTMQMYEYEDHDSSIISLLNPKFKIFTETYYR